MCKVLCTWQEDNEKEQNLLNQRNFVSLLFSCANEITLIDNSHREHKNIMEPRDFLFDPLCLCSDDLIVL